MWSLKFTLCFTLVGAVCSIEITTLPQHCCYSDIIWALQHCCNIVTILPMDISVQHCSNVAACQPSYKIVVRSFKVLFHNHSSTMFNWQWHIEMLQQHWCNITLTILMVLLYREYSRLLQCHCNINNFIEHVPWCNNIAAILL